MVTKEDWIVNVLLNFFKLKILQSIMIVTIEQANKLYSEGIAFSSDWKNLSDEFMRLVQKNNYPGSVTKPDFSFESTYHPLSVPITIKQVVERYKKEKDIAVDPSMIETFECIKKHNEFCEIGEVGYSSFLEDKREYGDKLDRINVTDYMNFLYFANEVLGAVEYHIPTKLVRPGLKKFLKKWDNNGFRESFKKERIKVKDPCPIIIMSNPKEDGLVDIFKDKLNAVSESLNRGIRILNLGGDEGAESFRDFYFNSKIKDFEYVNCDFENNPSKAYFGIWTKNSYVQGSFLGENDLFGLENKIKGEYNFDNKYRPKMEYDVMLDLFNDLKN